MCLRFKNLLKDNNKTAHWVDHSKLESLYNEDFFKKTPVVDDIQASLTGNTIEQSASGKKNNPDLLQEEEEQEVEEANDDADVNAEANEIDEYNNNKVISMEEEQNTLEYK